MQPGKFSGICGVALAGGDSACDVFLDIPVTTPSRILNPQEPTADLKTVFCPDRSSEGTGLKGNLRPLFTRASHLS